MPKNKKYRGMISMAILNEINGQQFFNQVKLDRFAGKSVFPEVYLTLNNSLEMETNSILEDLKTIPVLPIENLLENIPEVCEIKEESFIVGVDAGSNGAPLEGFYFGAATGIAYLSQICTSDGNIAIFSSGKPLSRGGTFRCSDCDRPRRHLSLVEFAYLYSTALEAIIRIDPQILFIDGGLLLNPLFLPSREEVSSEKEELFLEDIDLDLVEQTLIKKKRDYYIDFLCTIYFALELFREGERRKIPIIGIIKRPRGFSFFNNHFPDSVVLEKAGMPFGTKTKVKFVGSHPVTSKYDILWEKFYGETPGIRFGDKENGYLKEFYLKTVAGREPIRVQIPYWVNDKQAATLTFFFSDNYEGVPVPILKADALTCVSDRLLHNLHTKLSLKLNMRAKLEGLKPWETGLIRLKR